MVNIYKETNTKGGETMNREEQEYLDRLNEFRAGINKSVGEMLENERYEDYDVTIKLDKNEITLPLHSELFELLESLIDNEITDLRERMRG